MEGEKGISSVDLKSEWRWRRGGDLRRRETVVGFSGDRVG